MYEMSMIDPWPKETIIDKLIPIIKVSFWLYILICVEKGKN